MGGTPVNNSAGKATKLPPPATALIPPPRAPAENRKMAVCRFKQKFYHERGSPAKERLFGGMKEGNESMMRALPDRSDFALRGVRQIRGCQLVLAERVSQNSSQRRSEEHTSELQS